MEHIYSDYFRDKSKITEKRTQILGIVLHDDAENMAAKDYIDWLKDRAREGCLYKGWASIYIDKDTCYWFHPIDYIEWHCGNQFANEHYVGIERCQSKINGVLSDRQFEEIEEASFKIAAKILKEQNLPVNRDTVRLHREFFETACPARAWQIHVNNSEDSEVNRERLKDYFISRIQTYYNQVKIDKTAILR
ncbi:peptidoglycan recognition protein family protein [Staphylococcus durrellii]|uniref:peptidoglycan recognition protein family protein n=1 Tax=Staphylococcus durrellii TaxID=2781773 RepID=UPI0018A09786|nr:N-acetylmuramoyl-L-alanine amidase [Staphylococcus durrellii]MBF7016330.1 N-acetylmuramoyl-L-alanine amidase [Staphylococcus durrellii]